MESWTKFSRHPSRTKVGFGEGSSSPSTPSRVPGDLDGCVLPWAAALCGLVIVTAALG